MLNLSPQFRANSTQQNLTAMQGKRRNPQQRPIENTLFDNPVQKAKSVAVSAGKVGFLVGMVSSFLSIKQIRNDISAQKTMFSEVIDQSASKTAKVITEKAAKPLQEKSKGLIKKVMEIKPGDIRKIVQNFVNHPKTQKAVGNAAHFVASLIGGVNTSMKYALTAGTVVLGLGALVKFADNQAMINDKLKARK